MQRNFFSIRRAQAMSCDSHTLERGFTLVEVLVAIVIFSFGLLGMAGMQAFALQSNREAKLQSQASSLGRELAEMMRNNNMVAIRTTNNPYLGAFNVASLTPSSSNYCLNVSNNAIGCASTNEVAASEMTDWLARTDNILPGARVNVCFDTTPYTTEGLPQWTCSNTGDVAVIKIGWTQSSTQRGQTGSAAFSYASDGSSRPAILIPVTSGRPE